MGIEIASQVRSRAQRTSDFLQFLDYRQARSENDLNELFALRYRAYVREGSIEPNSTGLFSDEYDLMDNCWIFGVYAGDWLISSIRFHVIGPAFRRGPALDVFPDIVWPMIEAGKTVIDPTRFVIDDTATREFPDLAFLTLRVACMASEYFEADYCLATVRKEHQAFYRRVYKSEVLCEPRPYPTLSAPISLMRADVRSIRDSLMQRYPVFLSSFTERRMLFDRREPALAAESDIGRRSESRILRAVN